MMGWDEFERGVRDAWERQPEQIDRRKGALLREFDELLETQAMQAVRATFERSL